MQIESTADEIWNKSDKEFYQYKDNLVELLVKYITENRREFEK